MNFEIAGEAAIGSFRKDGQRRDLPARTRRLGSLSTYYPAFALALLIALFVGLEFCLPLGTAVKIGADEDYELAKATLCNHGYKLYSEVWDDQPPFVTRIIAGVSRQASNPILAARLLTVGFSVLLLAATFILVRALNGTTTATIATAMLIGSPGFMELSSSVMQELLAFALVVTSLCWLWMAPRGKFTRTELPAGIIFGFGLQMKLIGLMYLPLATLILWLRIEESDTGAPVEKGSENPSSVLKRVINASLIFGLSTVVTFITLNLLTGNSLFLQLQQSWAAHFADAKSVEYGSPGEHGYDWTVPLKNWEATLPALLGVCVLLGRLRRNRSAIIPVAWLGLSFFVFGRHKPWWPYYYVHNALPLCWCAAAGIEAALVRLGARLVNGVSEAKRKNAIAMRRTRMPGARVQRRPWLQVSAVAIFALCASGWIGMRVYLEESAIRGAPRLDTALVLKEINRFRPFTTFMFSDRPVYSFHAGIPMPPHLAVISLKRFWTGDLSNSKLTDELKAVKPGLVLLGNEGQPVPYEDLLTREYRLVYQDGANRLYAHKSISKKPAF